MKTLIEANRWITIHYEIATRLNLLNSTIYDHMKWFGFVSKFDIWVSHVLKKKDLLRRINICNLLLKCEENDSFLKRIVTEDEKWINMIMLNENDHEVVEMSRRKAFQKPTFTKKKCSLFGRISIE